MFIKRSKMFLLLTLIFITILALATVSAADTSNNITDDVNINDLSSNDIESYDIQTSVVSTNKQVNEDTIEENNLEADADSNIVYVDVSGNPSSNGNDSTNPTTINNAFSNVKQNGTIILLGNLDTTVYSITQNITSYTIKTGVTNFKITSAENSNIILQFSRYNGIRLSGNYNIEISNISFTRTQESECPVIENNAILTLNDCSFYNINNIYRFGAIYNTRNLILNNCAFYDNYALRQASVIYTENATVNIYNSNFYNNTAEENGAVISSMKSRITVLNSTFTSNTAAFGGVISIRDNSQLNVNESTFINNSAKYNGGVLDSWYSAGIFNHSIFINNSADYGGVTYSVNSVETKILNSLMDSNFAYINANTVYAYRDNLTVNNSVIMDNTEAMSIYAYNASYRLDNNWWGVNNPNFSEITNNLLPNNWRLMTIKLSGNNKINVSLNQLTGSKIINDELSDRVVLFEYNGNSESTSISSTLIKEITGNSEDITVKIDNQSLKLSDKIIPYISLSDINAKINDNVTIVVKCNPDITSDISIKINGNLLTNVVPVKGTATYRYSFNSTWNTGTYTVSASIINNTNYADTIITSTLNLKDNFNTSVILITNKNPNNYEYDSQQPKGSRSIDEAKEYQSSVKDQASSGSCWAFSALAALEASYKTAYGIEYNFSENNMKNLLKKYSTIGDISDYPNGGNSEIEPIAYLVGWYGPIDEIDDVYDDYSMMSPLLNNTIKVEDVYFFYRTNATAGVDNRVLKEAIRKYGGLSTSIYAGSGKNLYSTEIYADHAVTLVGWDDFYSSSNFYGYTKPAGNGAYIIKNSWGEDTGIDGYQYVSYYDKSLAGVSYNSIFSSFSYAFPVKQYENYTNIYQHDVIAEKVITVTPEAWVRNVYTANKNESIAGVGTFIYEDTAYEAFIYVNDKLYYTQTGNITQEGYRIIKLDQYVPVTEGDVFKVDLKLKAFEGEYTAITLQDTSIYKSTSKENQSFISTDGENWEDLFTSYDIRYSAACLKVYTKETPLMTSWVNNTENYQITSKIENLDTNGRISYKIDDEDYTDDNGDVIYQTVNNNGIYSITIPSRDIEKYEYNVTIILETEGYTISENITIVTPVNITITTQNYTFLVDENKTITAKVEIDNNVYNNKINDGELLILDNDKIISKSNIVNGTATFNIDLNAGNHVYNLSYRGSPAYVCSYTKLNITVLKHNVTIEIVKIENNTVYGNVKVTGRVLADNSQPMKDAMVYYVFNGKSEYVKTDSRGMFTFSQSVNNTGDSMVTLTFRTNTTHSGAILEQNITINKQNTTLTIDKIKSIFIYEDVNITGNLINQFNGYINGTIILNVNGVDYNITVNDGCFKLNYIATILGTNNITVRYGGTDLYLASEDDSTFKVKKQGSIITINTLENINLNDNVTITGTLTNHNNNVINNSQVTININGKDNVLTVNEEGIFEYSFIADKCGTNEIAVYYDGDDIHLGTFMRDTFEVQGSSTIITLDNIPELKYMDEYNITGTLTDVNGNKIIKTAITLNINGRSNQLRTDGNGIYTYSYKTNIIGVNNVTVNYAGNDYYSESTASTTFNTVKADCIITYEPIGNIKYNDMITITGKFTDSKGIPLAKSTVTILVNGVKTNVKTDTDGSYLLMTKATKVGTNNITIKYLGSSNFNEFTTETIVNVEKQDLILTLENIDNTNYSKNYIVTGKFMDANNKAISKSNVKVIINGKTSYVKTDENGVYKLIIKAKTIGLNNVTVAYDGTDGYNPAQNVSTSFIISKQGLKVTLDKISDIAYGNNVTITGKFMDFDSKALAKSNVKILINGAKYYAKTDENGTYTLIVKAKTMGLNNVTAGYDGTYGSNPARNILRTFNVIKQDCIITHTDIKEVACNDNINISGTFTDANGLKITNTKIKIQLNNNTYYTKTDTNGNYVFTTKATVTGTNNLTIEYEGNTKYNPYKANTSFNVIKQDVIITYNPIKNTKLNNNFTITGTFTDKNGKALTNSKVRITVNGKVNYVVTDTNGDYVFTAKATIVGVNNVTVGYVGNDRYNAYSTQTIFTVEE